jgi:hypothetical protein
MADRRISGLVEVVTPNPTDVLPIVNSGITKKVALDNLVKNSIFSTFKINSLNPTVAPGPTDQVVIQPTDGSNPLKVQLQNIYPVIQDSSTIDLTFNPSNRFLGASVILSSISTQHLSAGAVTTQIIANGAITEAKIDPNAKIRGATGGGTDRVFYENDQVVTTAYTITSGKNAMTAGPITINDGIAVTVPDGSTWTVV